MVYAEMGGSRSGFFACGVASLQLIPFNSHRTKLIITNNGANTCYFAKGDSAAVVGSGVPLLAGGSWIIQPDTLGRIWKGALQCISGVAAQNIAWTEDW